MATGAINLSDEEVEVANEILDKTEYGRPAVPERKLTGNSANDVGQCLRNLKDLSPPWVSPHDTGTATIWYPTHFLTALDLLEKRGFTDSKAEAAEDLSDHFDDDGRAGLSELFGVDRKAVITHYSEIVMD